MVDNQSSQEIRLSRSLNNAVVDNLEFEKKIYSAENLEVWEAHSKRDPAQQWVIKKIRRSAYDSKRIEAEIYISKLLLNNINRSVETIVKVFDYCYKKGEDMVYLVMEKCDMNLRKYLEGKGALGERKAIQIFSQIYEGYMVLRNNRIFHRDLDPTNILVKIEGTREVFKIADFGISIVVPDFDAKFQEFVGKFLYMAPQISLAEVRDERIPKPYSSKADIFSLGVILYEMIYGRLPFYNGVHVREYCKILLDYEKNPDVLEFDDSNVSEATKDLIRGMLAFTEAARINLDQLDKDSFLISSITSSGEDWSRKTYPSMTRCFTEGASYDDNPDILTHPELLDSEMSEKSSQSLKSWNMDAWGTLVEHLEFEIAKIYFYNEVVLYCLPQVIEAFAVENGIQFRAVFTKYLWIRATDLLKNLGNDVSIFGEKSTVWIAYSLTEANEDLMKSIKLIIGQAEKVLNGPLAEANPEFVDKLNQIKKADKEFAKIFEFEKSDALKDLKEFLSFEKASADDLRAGIKVLSLFKKMSSLFRTGKAKEIEHFTEELQRMQLGDLRKKYTSTYDEIALALRH